MTKTPEEIAGEIFDAAFTLTESERFDDGRQDVEECSADYIREQIRLAILADRAQRDAPDSLSAIISRQLDMIRDQLARIEELEQLNVIAHDVQRDRETDVARLCDQVELLRSQLAEAENESTEVIRKCNEQLAALAAAAKLRDQQVETLSRLWLAAFEETGSPLGPVLTRQLYRVMADHGIDVTNMPDPLTIDRADCA